MKELKMLYRSKNEMTDVVYLYDKENKVVLPVEDTEHSDDAYIYTIKCLIGLISKKDTCLEIYKCLDNKFYCYLNLKHRQGNIRINCPTKFFTDMATNSEYKLLTKEEILDEHGIKVTQEIIGECLKA